MLKLCYNTGMKNKVGRPKFQIDYDAVKKLSILHCTQMEIASYLGCSVDTLQRDETFCGIYKDEIQKGKISIRRMQYKSAEAGNVTMQIWLGKQYLGQKEMASIEYSENIDDTVKALDEYLAGTKENY